MSKPSNELFEELSVTELEDRLELTARCLCRNKDTPQDPPPIIIEEY